MPTVKLVLDLYMGSCCIVGTLFFIRSFHKWPRVGLIQYPLALVCCSIGWPVFIGKEYF